MLETNVIFSKRALVQVECSYDERAQLFHQKSDKFLWKVQMFLKAVTLSSRNQIFPQIFVCTRKMHFWRLCWNFWAKFGRKFILRSQNWWKNSKLVEKISKLSSRIGKRSLINSEQRRSCLIKKISQLSRETIWKT